MRTITALRCCAWKYCWITYVPSRVAYSLMDGPFHIQSLNSRNSCKDKKVDLHKTL